MSPRILRRISPVEQDVSGCVTHTVLLGFLCGRARCVKVTYVAVCMAFEILDHRRGLPETAGMKMIT